jgi:hypothetical protein
MIGGMSTILLHCLLRIPVHSEIQELNKRIKIVAAVLNLKGHWAGLAQKRFLYTCCDIGISYAPSPHCPYLMHVWLIPCIPPNAEGHRGTDGHYYVVVPTNFTNTIQYK